MKLRIQPQANLGSTAGARCKPAAIFVAPRKAEPLHAAVRAPNDIRPRRAPQPRTVRVSAEAPRISGRYAELLQGSRDAQEAMSWSVATVIENRQASTDTRASSLCFSSINPQPLQNMCRRISKKKKKRYAW